MKCLRICFFVFLLVPNDAFSQIEQQRAMNWCWVACIQSCLYQATGQQVSQYKIAADLDGWPRDRPAHINEVVNLLRYYGFKSWRAGRPASPDELSQSMNLGWKLVAFVRPSGGSVGHFIVLQAMDQWGNVTVSDPATGSTIRQPLSSLYNDWRWEDSVLVGR